MNSKPLPQPILATTRLMADLDTIVAAAGTVGSSWKEVTLKNSGVDTITQNGGVYCFVLRGLVGGARTHLTPRKLEAARETLQEYGSVHYVEHAHKNESADYRTASEIGECLVAERDLLEIKLIAAYAPPFNIKAER